MSNVVQFTQTGFRGQIRDAQAEKCLVRVWRDVLEPGSFCGYVVDTGADFFLLWAVGDHLGFDGIYALRHRDVTDLEAPEATADFIEKALALAELTPRYPKNLNLNNKADLLRSLAEVSAVVSLHVDSEGPHEVCYVGKVLRVEAEGAVIQELSPNAEWLSEASFFAFDEISAMSISSPYNLALQAVAGPAPDDVRIPDQDKGSST